MNWQSLNISFEFFPPKTTEGMVKLHNTALQLAKCQPKFFSVTFGAGGSTRDGTIETVKMLQKATSVPAAPHLSCVGESRAEIIKILKLYRELGIKRIVALRGDLPSGMGQSGELPYAKDLVNLIRAETQDFFHVEVAAYPECHPQALNAQQDIMNLKQKMDVGANSAITQYFFNADAYFYFVDACTKQGINIPIVPGIMPIASFAKLVRFSDSCGAEIPRWVRKRLEAYGDDVESIHSAGIEIVHGLCERLISGGAPGMHFYTLNHADTSVQLLDLLRKQFTLDTLSVAR